VSSKVGKARHELHAVFGHETLKLRFHLLHRLGQF